METILQATLASLRVTFTVDGIATDPLDELVNVTVRGVDGLAIVDDDIATRIDVGVYGYTLDATQTAALDILTAAWTGALSGAEQTLTTLTQIAGGFFFAASEFKARYPNDAKVQGLSYAQVAAARRAAEEIIERACHVAFVRRLKLVTVSGRGESLVPVPVYLLRRLRYLAVDGVAADVSECVVGPGGIYRRTPFPLGQRNVVVAVEHGYDEPSSWLKDAALTLAYHRAIKGPVTDRAVALPAGDAGGTITLLTPGVGQAVTGIPDVDEAISEHALPDPGSVSTVIPVDPSGAFLWQ